MTIDNTILHSSSTHPHTQTMDGQVNQQRICGLLGGLSYVSTIDYYNYMNQLVSELLPGHSSRIHIVSLDIFQYIALLEQSEWSQVADYLLEGVHQLVKTGIDFLLICSNTGHIAVPRITQFYPDLVVVHVSDAVAFAIKQKKFKKIGFLGSKMAMKSDSCAVERLIEHGLNIVFPNEDEIVQVHRIIVTELTVNILTEESKQIYLRVIRRLCDEHQVEGIVLGCTEIPLLVKQSDIPHVPLFDSTQLHAQLAVDYQLGRCDIEAFLPADKRKK